MQDLKALLDRAESAMADADVLEPAVAQEMLCALIDDVERVWSETPETNADLAYVAGCAWYKLPNFSDKEAAQAVKWFTHVLAVKPSHHYARLYLGHTYFDMGSYSEAKCCFDHIPVGYFATCTNSDTPCPLRAE